MKSLVSIIIPVYKVEEYLDRCVESVVGQTYVNLEIILVDDGSPDSCPQKCDAWRAKDPRIKVVHKNNAGLGYARNSGLDIAEGEYITFVDSDDYIPLNTIEIMVKRIENDKSDLIVGIKAFEYPDGSRETPKNVWHQDLVITRDDAFHMLTSPSCTFPVSACTKLYKRGLFKGLRFSSLKTAEDTQLAPFVIERCETISLMTDVVYYYYQRETSIVHTMTDIKQMDNIRSITSVARFLWDRNYQKEATHYYHAALCKVLSLKRRKDGKQLIDETFSVKEQKLLRKGRTKQKRFELLAARFPSAYRFYRSLFKS